jgi:hypothetical protein
MDPNACYRRFLAALREGDVEEAAEALCDLTL